MMDSALRRMAALHLRLCSFLLFLSVAASTVLDPPCDSMIYCYGPLLHTVQMSNIFNDSKTFVDMPLKNSPQITLKNFGKFMNDTRQNPTKSQVRAFVESNFKKPGAEFVPWNPVDWIPNPDFLKNIIDPDLEDWAKDLNELWKHLGRQTSADVFENPEKYSLMYLPNPIIVPGGRFREVYYWDSYWTIEGLLLSGMHNTTKGMLENFIEFVRKYGKVPNGGRIYYTRRSQPPYLISMVKLYVDYTGDLDFVRNNIDVLEQEFMFWETQRTVGVRDTKTDKVHKIAQYNVHVDNPRPESYREDYELAENRISEDEKAKMYSELASGAESGWDYSTRWFVKGDTNKASETSENRFYAKPLSTLRNLVSSVLNPSPLNPDPDCFSPDPHNSDACVEGNMSDLNVTAIAPVDLNSLLCMNAKILSDFYKEIGNVNKSAKFSDIASVKNQTLAELFWDKEDGIWYDLNIHNMKKRKYFYLSNIHPLWSGCNGYEGDRKNTLKKVIKYLKKEKVVDYIGGVPTSLKNSSQQWDYPNAWAPLQHHVIMGLYNLRQYDTDAEPLAFDLAEKWIRSNFQGYQEIQKMFEKYNVKYPGSAGRGGEYEVQEGFGWSNGVAMKMLQMFGDRLTPTTGTSTRDIEFFSIAFYLPTIMMIFISSRLDL